MDTYPVDGIYETRSHTAKFFPDRNVYIQGGAVRLVEDKHNYLFNYSFFFAVNTLGDRLGDLPADFDIRIKGVV